MTFNFFSWTQGSSFYPAIHGVPRMRRTRLVARWRRGPDGKLECRWERGSYT